MLSPPHRGPHTDATLDTSRPRYSRVCGNFSAIAIILAHVFITGIVAGATEYVATSAISTKLRKKHRESLLLMYGSHSITILGLMLYPIFGLMADVCFGRYWTVTVSALLMALSVFLTSILKPLYNAFWDDHKPNSLLTVMIITVYLLAQVGVAGFEANVVQFGLDQLMDQSSRCLSLYLHLLVWIRQVGVAVIILPFSLLDCDRKTGETNFKGDFQFIPLALFSLLVVPLLVILIRMRKSFYRELGNINPYKMVVKVIGYALKNRHPQGRRSAFFYYHGLNPGRLDFAKVHYGGPFSTEDVENVKTLLQMLGVIICVGPVFILKVSTSYFLYQHFVQHFVSQAFIKKNCPTFWPLMGSGNQINIITVLLYPLYIVLVFRVLKSIPKILLRLLVGLVLITLCLLSFLLIEVAGHYTFNSNEEYVNKTIYCALSVDHSIDNSLNIPWASLLIPNILYGLGCPIIYTAVFEFISAQSPKSMTGLLIGTFFFVMGIFQLLGTVLVVPFTSKKLWKHAVHNNSTLYSFEDPFEDMLDYDRFFDDSGPNENMNTPLASTACEIWYLVITTAFGILGVTLFFIAMRKYKYRKREEPPFPQSDIEEIVTRDIEQDTRNLLDVASVDVQRRDYGGF